MRHKAHNQSSIVQILIANKNLNFVGEGTYLIFEKRILIHTHLWEGSLAIGFLSKFPLSVGNSSPFVSKHDFAVSVSQVKTWKQRSYAYGRTGKKGGL